MLKIQFYYLMNRVSLTFLAATSALLTGAFLYASRFYQGMSSLDAFREEYRLEFLSESIGATKFILVTTALFLHIHCFLAGNGKYSAFFVSDGKSRIVFMTTKLGMAGLLVAGSAVYAWGAYQLIGSYLTPYFAFSIEETILFLWMGAEALCFGLLEALVMQLTDSIFSGIIPLSVYWFLEINAGDIPQGMEILYRFIPHLVPEGSDFIVHATPIGCGFLLAVLFIANLVIFKRRDIK